MLSLILSSEQSYLNVKNNEIVYNFSYKIQGTENIQNATISAANKVCKQYLGRAL